MTIPEFDTKILISSQRGEIVVESLTMDGIIVRKNVSPEHLASCINRSHVDADVHGSGLLPPNCIGTTMVGTHQFYFLATSLTHVELTYQQTTYPDFPIPRMVFGFCYEPLDQKVRRTCVCVVPEGRLTNDTKLYDYPFSNVGGNGSICLGNNALPLYKHPEQLSTLPNYILQMPNNNDHYSKYQNRLNLEYRDLLEYMKDKSPADYYRDILVESGKTLGQFLEWR